MKKGQFVLGTKIGYFILVIFIFTFILFIALGVYSGYAGAYAKESETVHYYALSTRTLHCFTLVQPTGRVQYGVLDSEKLNQETLNECLSHHKDYVNVRVRGLEQDIALSLNNPQQVQARTYNVLLQQGNTRIPATITIGVHV